MCNEKTPKDDVEDLLTAGLPIAQQLLEEHGQFFPFGYALTLEDDLQHFLVEGDRSPEDCATVIELLERGFVDGVGSGSFKAVAYFMNVAVNPTPGSDPVDAIQAGLEHRDRYAVNVFLPYQTAANGSFDYGELFATARPDGVFAC